MKFRGIISACSFGNFLEWYDYALYGYLTSILSHVFFPGSDIQARLNILLIFGIGFIARPLGSVIFGWIGDRWGRKEGLIYSIFFMIFPTILMAFLPTYLQIGLSAALLLALLRIIQGIPVGGETAGIMCYLTEMAPKGQKTYFGSWSVFGSQIGFIISSLEIYILEKWIEPVFFAQWGWRFTFVFGGLLGFFGWYLRIKLHETEEFQNAVHRHHVLKNPVGVLFQNYKIQIFQVFLLSSITSGAFYVIYFFSIFFLNDYLKINFFNTLLINSCMLLFSSICLPIFGKLGTVCNPKKLYITSSLGALFLPFFLFYFANQNNKYGTFFIYITLTIFLTLNYALLPSLISSLFPTPVRFTGLGVGYNASNAIFGGPAPFICLYLIHLTGNNLAPAFYFIFLAIINLIPFFMKSFREHSLSNRL